jgi:uncharacterized protein (UPF0303 family)
MTIQEYKEKQKELKAEYTKKEQALYFEFVKANSPYKVGDIVTDHIGSIEVERISFGYSIDSMPCVIYIGTELKKDGTKKKNNSVRSVYSTNIRKV